VKNWYIAIAIRSACRHRLIERCRKWIEAQIVNLCAVLRHGTGGESNSRYEPHWPFTGVEHAEQSEKWFAIRFEARFYFNALESLRADAWNDIAPY